MLDPECYACAQTFFGGDFVAILKVRQARVIVATPSASIVAIPDIPAARRYRLARGTLQIGRWQSGAFVSVKHDDMRLNTVQMPVATTIYRRLISAWMVDAKRGHGL